MQIMSERCAGLDFGKDEVVGCVRTPAASGSRSSELRVFNTFTSGLEELADWLTSNGVVEVVMEATGQYWKPIWYVLEDRGFDLRLVNAKHVKMVPGRKTDLADAARRHAPTLEKTNRQAAPPLGDPRSRTPPKPPTTRTHPGPQRGIP